MSPRRIQMSRQRPWRADNPDAVIVARPTRWGNPWRIEPGPRTRALIRHADTGYVWAHPSLMKARAVAVVAYRCSIDDEHDDTVPTVDEIRRELAGRDLACWCPLDQPCHADALLNIANAPAPNVDRVMVAPAGTPITDDEGWQELGFLPGSIDFHPAWNAAQEETSVTYVTVLPNLDEFHNGMLRAFRSPFPAAATARRPLAGFASLNDWYHRDAFPDFEQAIREAVAHADLEQTRAHITARGFDADEVLTAWHAVTATAPVPVPYDHLRHLISQGLDPRPWRTYEDVQTAVLMDAARSIYAALRPVTEMVADARQALVAFADWLLVAPPRHGPPDHSHRDTYQPRINPQSHPAPPRRFYRRA